MFEPLLAAAWDDFFKVLPFIVVLLVWVINQFAGKIQPQLQKRVPPANPAPPPRPPQQAAQQPGQQPLQAEIDEFLRQAQAMREGRAPPPRKQPVGGGQPVPPPAAPSSAGRSRPVPPRNRQEATAKRENRPTPPRPTPVPSTSAKAPDPEYPRESVSQYVADHIDSSKFAKRATSLSQIDKETDEFQQHMQRVFERDVGTLQKGPLGMFEATGAAAAATSAAAAASATAAAGGAETATAPTATYKAASNIALFLAGRNNIRDAVILSEILRRPEDHW